MNALAVVAILNASLEYEMPKDFKHDVIIDVEALLQEGPAEDFLWILTDRSTYIIFHDNKELLSMAARNGFASEIGPNIRHYFIWANDELREIDHEAFVAKAARMHRYLMVKEYESSLRG